MNPTISVIIPAFNEEKLIGRCLTALKKQTYPKEKFEIIVVDNNSTDNTKIIARKHNVKVINYTKMNVVAAVRNFGVLHAKAPLVAFMDSDSVASEDWLESIVSLMQNKHIVAVCGVGLPLKKSLAQVVMFDLYNQFLRLHTPFGIVVAWGFNLAVRKAAYYQVDGYNSSLRAFDDTDLAIRLQKKFGRKSVIYSQKLKVYTSTRKQENILTLMPYVWSATLNHLSIVFLRRTIQAELKNVR